MTTAVAKKKTDGSLKSLLTSDAVKKQIAVALPKHMDADRMSRVALTALLKTPKLAQCSQESFMQCVLSCSQLGIEPDGRLAHLIPYGKDCTLIIDYKGLVALARRSGNVATIHADVVCENDDFVYDSGCIKRHVVDFKKPRGDVYAAYAKVQMKDGTEQCEVLSKDEIEAVRNRSRAKGSGPWVTDWNEMAKKTCFRRLSKWLELSPEYRNAVAIDDDPRISGDVIETTVTSPATIELNNLLTEEPAGNDIADRLRDRIMQAKDVDTLTSIVEEVDRAREEGAIDEDTMAELYAAANELQETLS